MNRLDMARRARVVAALVEGNSLRATARLTGVARMTIEKLLRDLGSACETFHGKTVRNLKTKRVQADEIWAFCYAKARNVTPEIREQHPDAGDVWTWTAIDAESKLMISWLVGKRDVPTASFFMRDVASRLANRVQLTTDGLSIYMHAVDAGFSGDVDWAVLNKVYKGGQDGRFSPPKLSHTMRATMTGRPDAGHVSTSYVERSNLTMRMHMRRFTRLTNGFSKKAEMHAHSVALHFTYYNFCKVHQTLRVTPAMEAGISDHVWSLEELVSLLD
ncbi:MAG: IS1 family transposase [Vicinamibacterales bacterium]